MSGKTRYTQTERVLLILHALCTHGSEPMSLGQISDRVLGVGKGISERTIYRDLDFLESTMGYVCRKTGTKGYFLSNEFRFPLSKRLVQKLMKC